MDSASVYPLGLALFSVLLLLLERRFPWRRDQPQLRPALWSDVLHLVFNGHFLGVILYAVALRHLIPPLDHWLGAHGLVGHVYRNTAATWPLWLQIPACLLGVDFLQWCIHNLLHRVPLLWRFHQIHHSVTPGEMDFWVSFRFHWVELAVYRILLYLPLAWLGFGEIAVLVHALAGTLVGHFNHSNLDLGHGRWRYLVNSPRMHIWHHHDEPGVPPHVNFGIIFSLWDFLFRTAHLPPAPPRRLGFPGVADVPRSFFRQAVWPLERLLPARAPGAALGSLGVLLVGVAGLGYLPRHAAQHTPLLGETVASSQPAGAAASPAAYSRTAAEADAALVRFGEEARAAGYAHPESLVSVAELARALQSPHLRILDVRPSERFEKGRIPSAQPVWIPDYAQDKPIPGLSRPPRELEALLRSRGVRKDSVVVLYGDGEPEVYRFWWTLRLVGGYETAILDGGLGRWKAEGHAVVRGPPRPVEPGDVVLAGPAEPPPLLWRDIQALLGAPDEGGAVLLDTRSLGEYRGEVKHPKAARAGRIPGARHLDWARVLRGGEDSRLRPVSELAALLRHYAPTPTTRVITSCQSGTRSSVVYFAFYETGHDLDRLVNYDGSWAEYSRLDLPAASGAPGADGREPSGVLPEPAP